MKKEERIYQGVMITLLCVMTVLFLASNRNLIKMVKCNEDLLNLIDEQEIRHESLIKIWEDSYSELEDEYSGLLVENMKLKETELPEYKYTKEEIDILARCVEAEAGNYKNHKNSQRYITQVILNRLHSGEFPDSIKEVIYQKIDNIPQFSVAYNGMMDREVEVETLVNVYSVLIHGTDLPDYVCYFYSDSVTDNWVNTLDIYDTVEGTVFAYEEDKEE